jgi:hypothetical protein
MARLEWLGMEWLGMEEVSFGLIVKAGMKKIRFWPYCNGLQW